MDSGWQQRLGGAFYGLIAESSLQDRPHRALMCHHAHELRAVSFPHVQVVGNTHTHMLRQISGRKPTACLLVAAKCFGSWWKQLVDHVHL